MGKKSKKSSKKSYPEVDVKAWYQTGLAHFKNNAYHAAIVEWRKIPDPHYTAEMKSQLAEACFRRGLELYPQLVTGDQEKVFSQMIAMLTNATNLQSNKSIYHYHLGLAYHRSQNYKKAILSYRRAVDLDINDRYLLHLILAYLKEGNVTEAEFYWQLMENKKEFLSSLISIFNEQEVSIVKENSIENTFLTGLIHLRTKKIELARASFEKALKLCSANKNDPIVNRLAGYICYFLGLVEQSRDEEKAKVYWEQLLNIKLMGERLKKNLAVYFFNQGMRLAQGGRYMAAVSHWSQAQKMQPHNEVITNNINLARFLYANQAAQQGDLEKAIKLWSSSPIKNDINRIHNIALALDRLEQPREANFQWLKVLEQWKQEYHSRSNSRLKDHLIIAHKHLAQNYLKINDEKRAIKEFENVLQLAPDDIETRSRLGDLLAENGHWNRALKEFKEILKLKPDDIDTAVNVAFIYDQMDEHESALDLLQNILKTEPNHIQAKRKLGEIYHEQAHEAWNEWNYDDAIELFQQQIELTPDEYTGYKCLSNLYDELGRKKDVDSLLDNFINSDPENPMTYTKVACIYFEIGSTTKANKYLTIAEKLKPNDSRMLIELGKAVFAFSTRRAKTYFDRAINLAPDNAQLYSEIADFLGVHNPKMAIFYLEKYVRLERQNAHAFFELGMLYNLSNNKRESQQAIAMALTLAKKQGDEELINLIHKFKNIIANQFNIFGDRFFNF